MITRPAYANRGLFILIALVLFILAECAAQAWLTKGTWPEWVTGGFIALTLTAWE